MSYRCCFLASVAFAALSPAAFAQEAPAKSGVSPQAAGGDDASGAGSADIIVTARKQSERINDVPMSITAVTGETLARQGVASIADLQKISPAFSFQPSQYGNPVYNLRGIGNLDDSVSSAPTVSIYLDQAPIPFSVMAQGVSYDLERVEILKGPQGTLFGQNSTGGAINFVASKPTRTFEAGLDLTGGNFDTINVKGYASGPLSGTLAARVAVAIDKRGDWQRSISRPGDTLGQRSFWAGRFLLDWNPGDRLRFALNVNGWVDDSDTPASQFLFYSPTRPAAAGGYTDLAPFLSTFPRAPDDARAADWDPNTRLKRKDNMWQATFRGEYDLSDALTLTSLTAYSRFNRDFPIDTDGTPVNNMLMNVVGGIESFSQELRLGGSFADNRIKWMIGANYQRDQSDVDNRFRFTASNSGVGPFRYERVVSDFAQDVTTKSVFGSLDLAITESLTAQGSIRYTDSRNDFAGCLRDSGDGRLAAAFSVVSGNNIAPGDCVTINAANGASEMIFSTLHEDNISWRAGLDWKPAPGTLLYANVTKGYKAGNYPTPPAIFSPQLDPLPQEELLAYEAGFKQSLFGQALQFNGAAFYYDYTNKQISGFRLTAFGNLPSFVSIPKSSVRGIELSADLRPVQGLTISAGGAYVDTKVDEDFLTNDPFARVVNVKGEHFPTAPKWTLNADVEYRVPVSGDAEAYVGISPRYRSRTVAAFGDDPNFVIRGYTLLDLRAGVELNDGRWRIEAWGKNVTDKFYVTSVTKVVDTANRLTGMPATYGITLSFRH